MTEDEAKTKMCPILVAPAIAMGLGIPGSAQERIDMTTSINRCQASKCMIWVWLLTPNQAAQMNLQSNAKAKASGHCGLIKDYK